MQNATICSKMLQCQIGRLTFALEKQTKNIFRFGTGNALYRIKERESERMEMSVNGFIGSLPKFPRRKVWNVVMNGKIVQGVSSTDNREETAQAYIASKYPGQEFTLVFARWKTVTRFNG